jgi:RNA polymerase sigma-70 factor (ECF subfamily)
LVSATACLEFDRSVPGFEIVAAKLCETPPQSCYHAALVYAVESEYRDRVQPEAAQISDVELLHAVARGDEAALARLYDAYRVILFGLLVRILNNREEAEDILQDVFIQVWRRAKDFDERRGRPFTWLVTLARSRAIDRLRMLGARQRLTTGAAEEQERNESVSDALTDTLQSEQKAMVRRALAALPEEQRHTLLLAYFEGLTQSEIASRIGAPLGTVKTRMRSGMIKLRALLKSQLENFG